MKQQRLLSLCASGLLALPVLAGAHSQAYTNTTVNVRAGPASDYPIVTQLPPSVPLSVMGWLSNYQWCDVAAPNLRGWAYAGSLSYPYQGSNVLVMNYGHHDRTADRDVLDRRVLGNYYRGRPWYNQQSRWSHHPPPPPPRPDAGRPPGGGGGGGGGNRPPGGGAGGGSGGGRLGGN